MASPADLATAFGAVGTNFTPAISADDPRRDDLTRRFDEDRALMVVAERGDRIVGGAFGFRSEWGVTLRMLAVDERVRRVGLARRLMQTVEVEAMALGARGISLGAAVDAKPFYVALGYHGKSSMHKELPLPGRVLELRLRKWREALGDLDAGATLQLDERGRVVPLFTTAASASAAR